MREESGLTQADMAKRIGTTQSVISRLESGDYSRLSISTLLKVATVTGHRLCIEAEAV